MANFYGPGPEGNPPPGPPGGNSPPIPPRMADLSALTAALDQIARATKSTDDGIKQMLKNHKKLQDSAAQTASLTQKWTKSQQDMYNQMLVLEDDVIEKRLRKHKMMEGELIKGSNMTVQQLKRNLDDLSRGAGTAEQAATSQAVLGGMEPNVLQQSGLGAAYNRTLGPGSKIGGGIAGRIGRFGHPAEALAGAAARHPIIAGTIGVAAASSNLYNRGLNIPYTGISVPGVTEARQLGMETGGGAAEGYQAFRQAFKLGANPFDMISTQLAQAIVAGVRSKGFRGQMANALTESIVEVVKTTGIEWDTALSFFNREAKDFPARLAQMTETLKSLHDISDSTGLSVKEMASEVQSFADISYQKGGTPLGKATETATTIQTMFPGKPGIAPEFYAGVMQRFGPMMGIDPRVIHTPAAQKMFPKVFEEKALPFLKQMYQTQPGTPEEKAARMASLAPEIFGSMDVADIISLMEGGAHPFQQAEKQKKLEIRSKNLRRESEGEGAWDWLKKNNIFTEGTMPDWMPDMGPSGIDVFKDFFFGTQSEKEQQQERQANILKAQSMAMGMPEDRQEALSGLMKSMTEKGIDPLATVDMLGKNVEDTSFDRALQAVVEKLGLDPSITDSFAGGLTKTSEQASYKTASVDVTIGIDPKSNKITIKDAHVASENYLVNAGQKRSNLANRRYPQGQT